MKALHDLLATHREALDPESRALLSIASMRELTRAPLRLEPVGNADLVPELDNLEQRALEQVASAIEAVELKLFESVVLLLRQHELEGALDA